MKTVCLFCRSVVYVHVCVFIRRPVALNVVLSVQYVVERGETFGAYASSCFFYRTHKRTENAVAIFYAREIDGGGFVSASSGRSLTSFPESPSAPHAERARAHVYVYTYKAGRWFTFRISHLSTCAPSRPFSPATPLPAYPRRISSLHFNVTWCARTCVLDVPPRDPRGQRARASSSDMNIVRVVVGWAKFHVR